MLKISEISKSFSDASFFKNESTKVLKKISLELRPGDFVELIGNNGSGKTTFLKIISGLIKQDSGDICPKYFSKTYVSSSERAFFWRLTVMENLQFFYNIRHPDYKKKRHSLCLDLLKRFDLLSFQDKLFMHLSSGQKKKVAIICALLNNSDVFLFDEVTTSLDEKSRNTLLKYLELIRKDKIIIWATHENELDNIKTKTLLISKGEINYV
tara:strand:- start:724 stop:1356 length:633 start_codon:yes stop_codon:yes gene_type:complete